MNISVLGEGCSIAVEVLGYERGEEDRAGEDLDWLCCHVVARTPAFSGSYAMSLVATDLVRFRELLDSVQASLIGHATLVGLEEDLELSIDVDSIGGVAVKVACNPLGNALGRLEFEFRTDQTVLPQLISQLTRITEAYPPKVLRGQPHLNDPS